MKRFINPTMNITIREVAALAGVSVTTASYALNGTGRIAAATREKVIKAAETLGYEPSIAARLLRGAKGNLVAVLTEGLAGPWYGEILEGLQPILSQKGLAVLAMTIQDDSLALCRSLISAGLLRGLVILNPEEAWTPALLPIAESIPTALFDPGFQDAKAMRYLLENREGIAALMEHLWERGYRDYLWLDGDLEAAWDARERHGAFEAFLDAKGLPRERRRRAFGGFKTEIAEASVARILQEGPPPRAIVAANDESAIGALNALRRAGLKVPEEVAVAGFDGLEISAWLNPGLTTLSYDRKALGKSMALAVLDAIDRGSAGSTRLIPLRLVIRGTT
jgi:LacI family transcriptional regulator